MKRQPVLITIPHHSKFLPPVIKKRLSFNDFELLHKTDPATDEIFGVANALVLKTKFCRVVGDPNRHPEDFDPKNPERNGIFTLEKMFEKSVFRKNPSPAEAKKWIAKFYQPYHNKIIKSLPCAKFLLDGHSLWSHDRKTGKARADVIIGNRHFETCDKVLTDKIKHFFEQKNFSVAINDPFAGQFILEKYCSKKSPPGVQIELNRKLYLNEKTMKPRKKDVVKLNKIITELIEMIANEV